MSSVLCLDIHRTFDRINYLFQNGRLLLTCIVLLSPTEAGIEGKGGSRQRGKEGAGIEGKGGRRWRGKKEAGRREKEGAGIEGKGGSRYRGERREQVEGR